MSDRAALVEKLCLGTVQFGTHYGLSNTLGKPSLQELNEILTYAFKNGIKTLDTSPTYGNSEELIGIVCKANKLNFDIVTKLSCTTNLYADIEKEITNSLSFLFSEHLYACLIHDFEWYLKNALVLDYLIDFQKKGLIKKIGFSLYHPAEAEYLLEHNIPIDIVQIPYSVLDQRFIDILPLLKKRNIEIHSRSVFLQGLFFVNEENLKPHFYPVKERLKQIRKLSFDSKIPYSTMLINFALFNKFIDKLIIGVDSFKNLTENMASLSYYEQCRTLEEKLINMSIMDESILLPYNWK